MKSARSILVLPISQAENEALQTTAVPGVVWKGKTPRKTAVPCKKVKGTNTIVEGETIPWVRAKKGVMANDERRSTERSMSVASPSLDRTPPSSPASNSPFNGPNEQKSSGVDKTAARQEPNLNLAKMKYQATPEREEGRRSITRELVEEKSDSRAVWRQRRVSEGE